MNKEIIVETLEDHGVLPAEELEKLCGIAKQGGRAGFKAAVEELIGEYRIVRTKKGRLASLASQGMARGELEVKRGRFGFVRATGGDIFVAERDMNGALNGETVLVKKTLEGKNEHKTEGKVIKLLSTEPYFAAGTFEKGRNCAFVICDDPLLQDVYVKKADAMGAKNRQKVIVEITKRRDKKKSAEGRVTEILGFKGDPGVDILSVARSFGLVQSFPPEVQREAAAIPREISQNELMRRETLFTKRVFTIDGDDSKDLDDAVSIEVLKNGHRLLGVHIADVSNYVRWGTHLDAEAFSRGTSVYLIDRVIPMLPVELSNGICSLNQGEIRLTLSCFMEIDKTGRIISHRLANTAIKSCHRLTYNEVNALLERDDEGVKRRLSDICGDLHEMEELAAQLRHIRSKRGSIDFDLAESKITLDEKGVPIAVGLRERGTAERLIEEFMLACNDTVAEEFFYAEQPMMYRVHETPDADKMKELRIFLSNFGIRMSGSATDIKSAALKKVLDESTDSEHENIINRVVLRSLKKARYCEENLGHFGLASLAYTHFTSPIRRYPDLIVHRIVKEKLADRLTEKSTLRWKRDLPGIASQTSARERRAIEAERKVDDMKKAQYIAGHIGETFEGVISGVVSTAFFVELANLIEGVIPLSSLNDDHYTFYKELYCVIGDRTKRRFSLGDKVNIIVKDVNIDTARVEFSLKPIQKKKRM